MGNLAKRLAKRLREARGHTSQLQFAAKLGVSKSSLNRMEMGIQNVTLDTLETLCHKLRCDVGDLFPR
jgi:DNA-binding Xre family transcriptional regulator